MQCIAFPDFGEHEGRREAAFALSCRSKTA
jgi:hypothetical protein